MTTFELNLLNGFLDRLRDVMSSAGCNDFTLLDTPEARDFMASSEDDCIQIKDGKIYTFDFVVLDKLRDRIDAREPMHVWLSGYGEKPCSTD